ncbi:MAG: glycine--tRNA ligase subunit beta [Gammaproteobacteria bacterium]
MSSRDFLFELGTEELPPKSLSALSEALEKHITTKLGDANLSFASSKAYATPRRLAVLIESLQERQADVEIKRRGPPTKVAFDADGAPTKAAQKFVESCGVPLDQLDVEKTDKGEWLYFEGTQPGQNAVDLIPDIVRGALERLPIDRRMRWGSAALEFVRPVHWSVMLWGDDIIRADILGTQSGRATRGHRFHAPEPIELENAREYEQVLRTQGHVIADFQDRYDQIQTLVRDTATELGGEAVGGALGYEVTALVEWPVPIAGQFDERFLDLPEEVLISTLKDHQRYYPLRGPNGKMLPWFITLSNIQSKDPSAVRNGNERVVRPRLSDAEFFYAQDRKTTLASRVDGLDAVLFQKDLGSLKAKADRIRAIAVTVAKAIDADPTQTARAADLCKCDLQTEMVGEFPELQGIMGRYYARHDNEPADVASAMAEQYLPRFSGDDLPTTGVGRALAIADRLDTICGIFAIGKPPSGTRDPYGLRRAALGILRIISEAKLDLDLAALTQHAVAQLPALTPPKGKTWPVGDALATLVNDYFRDRLRGMAIEQGATAGQFDAVASIDAAQPTDVLARVDAVSAFASTHAAESLIAANKRIANILKKSTESVADIDPARFEHAAESALHEALNAVSSDVVSSVSQRDYAGALGHLATLREPIDAFFDDVMVMADDADVRRNRLALLHALRAQFLGVADISLAAQ